MIMQRKKFLCVSPMSNIARQRFIHDMNSFHSCLVETETDEKDGEAEDSSTEDKKEEPEKKE